MPDVNFPSLVIDAGSGHQRQDKSWTPAHLLRDWEKIAEYDHSNPAPVATIFRVVEDARSGGRRQANLSLDEDKKPRADPGPKVPEVPELDL